MASFLKYDRYEEAQGVGFTPRLQKLIREANTTIKKFLDVSDKNIIAFSGGKDSIVATHIAVKYDIVNCITETSFMFQRSRNEQTTIAMEHNLKMVSVEGLSWDWLERNQKYCAPPMKIQGEVYAKRQQRTIKAYSNEAQYSGVLYGRRKQENTVKSDLYQLKNGQWQCHPLINWTTQDIWQYIHMYDLTFPHLYLHEIGKKEGFTPFLLPPEHFGGNVWKAIYDYEPAVVERFAEFHKPAQIFLNERQ